MCQGKKKQKLAREDRCNTKYVGTWQELRKRNLALVKALAAVEDNLFELPTDLSKLETAMPKPQITCLAVGRPKVLEDATAGGADRCHCDR